MCQLSSVQPSSNILLGHKKAAECKTEKRFANQENWDSGKRRALREFLVDVRRHFKYMTLETMCQNNLINECLQKLGLAISKNSNGGPDVGKMIAQRIQYFPCIKSLINNSMVEERSLLLKKVKSELKGEHPRVVKQLITFIHCRDTNHKMLQIGSIVRRTN